MERYISWENPTTFVDGAPIPPASVARIKIHVFKDGAENLVTLPGVTTWPIEVGDPGTTSTWELTAELDGQTSPKSPSFAYTEPFPQPTSPRNLAIS